MQAVLFSILLEKAMVQNGVSTHQRAVKILKKNGVENISHQRISDYLHNQRIPSPSLAQEMLDALDSHYELDYLEDVISYSKEQIKTNPDYNYNDGITKVRRNVTINFSELLPGFLGEAAREIMDERIEELCGDKSEFSKYVSNLIKNDLLKVALSKGDMSNG